MMKVLLTGATGFLGFRTLEKLVQVTEIETIIATGRTLRKTHQVNHQKVIYQLGDLSKKAFVFELVKGVDVIIHAAALSSPWGKKAAFYEANVITQQNLIEASVQCNLKKFVFISTPGVYYESIDKLNIKETDPLPAKFINAYAETKRLAEVELENSTIPYIILRPRAIVGRGDRVIMPRLIRAFDEGNLRIVGSGNNKVDLTSVANLADAIILAVFTKGKSLNQTYNITNGQPIILWDAIATVLKKLDRTPPIKKIPFWLIKLIAKSMELKSKLTDFKEPRLTVYGVTTLAKSMTLDIAKAKRLLKYEPKMTNEEAMEEFVECYKSQS